ncbi:HIRAN domain-containing protein [Pelagerythrobacter marinus]|nr:HIRAN domain-containing protein [Pelagerythrobacter marinus]
MLVSPPRPLSLAVVGADYPNTRGPGRRFEIALCKPGEPVELIPEPKNPADPRAIAVYSARGVQIGYLTAERAPWIGKLLREVEVRAIFQQVTNYGAVIRAAFGGVEPELPTAPATQNDEVDEEQDFWPDEEWPDG